VNSRRVVLLTLALVAVLAATAALGVVALRGRISSAGCSPVVAPVDPLATESAVCVAATLDSWKSRDVMGVGQQLNVQEAAKMRGPMEALGDLHPAVIGFDFDELLNAQAYFSNDPVPYLSDLAHAGRILTATWHTANPVTGGDSNDRSWTSIEELLDPQSEASKVFWPRYEKVLEQAKRFQDNDVSVIFKPLHEASGGWFWWGKPDPATYKALFAELQKRAYDAGVHNLLWAYAANPQNFEGDNDPVELLPDSVDLVGVDAYDYEAGKPHDKLVLNDYERLTAVAPRMAITETGPYNSTTGDWDPAIVTDTLRANGLYAAYAMLWRDNGSADSDYKYQLSSLTGGLRWLASCPDGLCSLTPEQ
jgi:hypothetical protein